ncbi:MAG: 3-deoxy-7-phosphoheptulonate synthase, partial [Halothermotrichaceae bacterium]
MKHNATESQIQHVVRRVEELGYTPHPSRGSKKMI